MPVQILVALHVAALELVVRLSCVLFCGPLGANRLLSVTLSVPSTIFILVTWDHNGVRETGFQLKSLRSLSLACFMVRGGPPSLKIGS